MAASFELIAEKREVKGTGASRRLRHAGKIPAIIYGAGKNSEMVSLDYNKVFHLLENEAFHTSIVDVKHNGKTEQVILREVQHHPFKQLIMHMDLQRISVSEKIHMQVPIHFIGEDEAPGVKLESGIVSRLINEVDVSCLPSELPEFLGVDVSEMKLHDSLHLSDIKLPEGVTLTALAYEGDDLAVVTIAAVRGSVEDEEAVEGEEGEAEGETPSEEEPKESE